MSLVYLQQSNLAANSVNDLMEDADTGASNIRFVRRPSRCVLAIEANAVGVEMRVLTQNRVLIQRSTLDSSGTTGQFPNLDQKAVTFALMGGEILTIELRETAGVATTDVMATLSIEPG